MSALALPVPEIAPVPARRRHLVAVPALVPEAPSTPSALPTERPGSAPAVTTHGDRLVRSRRTGADEGRLRLTVRGQIVLSVLALVVAAGLGSLLGVALPADGAVPSEVSTVTVGAGESLWVIAEQAAGPGEDVRVVIDQIMMLNGLSDSTVHAGQQLSVPAEG